MRRYNFSIIFVIAIVTVFLFSIGPSWATENNIEIIGNNSTPSNSTSTDNDAIAVRVVPNPNHYSIYRWYESQGFNGSPQALVVDGYEAIRDGRTVYVNAANIIPSSKTIYTNIYFISYNQDPNIKTVDILGQIVSHWKFNSNLTSANQTQSTCSISALLCTDDVDCQSGQACSDDGLCLLSEAPNCLVDEDCPANFFCDSVKAKVVRDIKRVGKLEELKEALAKYKEVNGSYPVLSAGTYLANNTISVWPSWNSTFLSGLSVAESFVDPINRLGVCAGFDQQTCWNEVSKTFVYDPSSGYVKLPNDSYAFVYSTDSNGSDYNLCAVMESRDLSDPDLGYQFSPNDPAPHQCVTATGIISGGQLNNTAPRIITQSLVGEAGQEYNGFIKAIDDQNNPISWAILPVSTSWPDWVNSTYNNAPILVDTNDPNQKKLYATTAGAPASYQMKLLLTDTEGASFQTILPIVINNQSPFIEAENATYVLDPVVPFDYSFFYSDNNVGASAVTNTSTGSGNGGALNKAAPDDNLSGGGNNGGQTSSSGYLITKIEGPFDILRASNLTETVSSAGINRYEVNFHGLIPESIKLYQDTDFVYEIKVTDEYGNFSTKKFTLTILVNDPVLSFNCPTASRVNYDYLCKLGSTKQGHYNLEYFSNPLPNGLYLKALSEAEAATELGGGVNTDSTGTGGSDNTDGNLDKNDSSVSKSIFLKIARYIGRLFNGVSAQEQPVLIKSMYLLGTPTATTEYYDINIKAVNNYGASSTRSFVLKINDYCGDGVKQEPNLEGRGGIYNDGYEDCDGEDGTTNSISASSVDLQYGCATEGTTPYPILNNSYCIFASPLEGGGFCGDGYCQNLIGETASNCSADCDPNCIPDCDGKQCGPNGCSGTCGVCDKGQTCNNGICEQICTPNCQGKQCGDDGCGGSCGNCTTSKYCNAAGHCVANSYCGDKVCNSNENCLTCLGDCPCQPGYACNPSTAACVPTCGNGTCDRGENCNSCASDCPCPNGQGCTSTGVCIDDCFPSCL